MNQTKKRFFSVISVLLSLLMVISVISLPILKANADGSAGTLDDFVERCYTVTLDRHSDAPGFADWKDQLLNGKAVGIEVAYGFLFSPEYTKKNKTNTEYVRDLYTLFMGRDPDEKGFNDWMNKLDEGTSRLDVFAGFANSQEFYNICDGYGITAGRYVMGYDRKTINNVNLYVERMYKICLGRIGDKDGQKNWVEQLIKKQISGTECARRFIFSQEYLNKNLSDEEFVENLYLAMFGRHSDAAGKSNWLYGLKNGMTRDEVFAGFANSVEFDNICKTYGIDRGTYTATNKGTFNKNNHTHVFDQKNTNEIYLKNAATCTKAAEYYYSCECGEFDKGKTFTSGKTLDHKWDKGTVTTNATLTKKGVKTFKCSQCNETKNEDIPCLLAETQVGDIIKFGKYEQDGDITNGKEDIEWQILSKEGNRVLVISKYGLDCKPYNETYKEVTWETCSLRTWLNDDFLNTAFSDKEKKVIPTVTVENKKNPNYGTAGGNNTNDKVFCLSLEEMESYFGDYSWYNDNNQYGYNQNLICTSTQYAINQGASVYSITEEDYNDDSYGLKNYGYTSDCIGRRGCYWWLRSPCINSNFACSVYRDGGAGAFYGSIVDNDVLAVRPALYIEY